MPTQAQITAWEPIEVYVSPLGNKVSPPDGVTKQQLLDSGWTIQKVGIPHDNQKLLAERLLGRRRQYGLRPRIASTNHAVLGQELSSLVTKVDMDDPEYSLWERAQVVVLLSRTRTAKDTIFIGSREVTTKSLTSTLLRMSQYTKYICYLLDVLTKSSDNGCATTFQPALVDQHYHPYRPIDIELPMDNSGCCYILVSCKDTSTTYIGQTQNLSERIDLHNSGHGSDQTKSLHLRPWAVLAYVVGFGGDVKNRVLFEEQWKQMRQSENKSHGRRLSAVEVADLALSVIALRKSNNPDEDLRFVRTGTVTTLRHNTPLTQTRRNTHDDDKHFENTNTHTAKSRDEVLYSLLSDNESSFDTKVTPMEGKRKQETKKTITARRVKHKFCKVFDVDSTLLSQQPTPQQREALPKAHVSLPTEAVSITLGTVAPSTSLNCTENNIVPSTFVAVSQPTTSSILPTHIIPTPAIPNRPLTLEEVELAMSSSNLTPMFLCQLNQTLSVLPTRTINVIFYRDYKYLFDRQWLSDAVIMYFLEKRLGNNVNVQVFGTFQYSIWRENHSNNSDFLHRGSDLHRFLCRRRNATILQRDVWLFPLHEHYHWQLLVILHPCSQQRRKIMLLDSLLPHRTDPSPNTPTVKLFSKQLLNTALRCYHNGRMEAPAYVTPQLDP